MSERYALATIVETFGQSRILCVGDVMLDHFLYGKVERISPEAPIPVLLIEREDAMLGGAGNVVRNVAALEATVRFITVIGDDHAGEEVARQFSDIGIADKPIIDDGRRTSTKTRYIANVQQILRADRETTIPLSDKIREKLIGEAIKAMADCDVVILSDYGKGVIDNHVAAEIIAAAKKARKPVIVDPKGADYEVYRGADIVTPNRRELTEASRMPTDSMDEVVSAAQCLIDGYGFEFVLATLGGEGMVLVAASGEVHQLGAEAREVYDVSGAGDTVAAVLAVALGGSGEMSSAAGLANVAAGIVVGKVGTAVAYTDDITRALLHRDISSAEAKVMSLRPGLDRIKAWRLEGQRIGFTNGCFDLLHPGHISLLSQAKSACDRLVVGLNSDGSINRLKGDHRPVQSEASRAQVLASLANVDMVIIFSEDTPIDLIGAIRPEVLIKGADYAIDQVVGADLVQGYGGEIVLACLKDGHSTTATIARINKQED